MCGRFALTSSAAILAELFGLAPADLPRLSPRYNIAPTQPATAVSTDPASGCRRAGLLHWGLIPAWANGPSIGSRMINARSETAGEKPAFREAIRTRRCLIPADGFYEWKQVRRKKQPHFIYPVDGGPLAFAGLWESWLDTRPDAAGEAVESFTILTTRPNTLLASLHDRMPVIILPNEFDFWLDPAIRDVAPLERLFEPVDSNLLMLYPVSSRVNSPANDGLQCIEPVPAVDDDEPTLFS